MVEFIFPTDLPNSLYRKYTGGTRRGRSVFDVQHDESKPFIVRVNDVSVQVLGTKFCISAYPENEGVMTTLVQGAVQVMSGDNQVVLKPGYQAVVDPHAGTISQRAVELSLYTSWVRGIFEYENMELKEIVLHRSHPWVGERIRSLDISRRSFIVLLKRPGRGIVPKGNVTLMEGDRLTMYTIKEGAEEPEELPRPIV